MRSPRTTTAHPDCIRSPSNTRSDRRTRTADAWPKLCEPMAMMKTRPHAARMEREYGTGVRTATMRSMKVTLPAFAVAIACAPMLSAQPSLTDRTFEVSGLSLHIRCAGERTPGTPLVILEAGAGNSADTWRDVHAPIAQFARACAYDRPGRGSSASPAAMLDAAAYVPLLSDLLKAAGEPGPYVLVGHSIGGVIAAL